MIKYEIITNLDQLENVSRLQTAIWGADSAVPVSLMKAGIHNGSIVIGAYEEEQLIGFCYGFPGFQEGKTYLCSHMLGIHPDYRNRGVGSELKLVQRSWALQYGYKKMVWTFDPLEARNAYLNLVKLGGYAKRYVPSYYGNMSGALNSGLPSDRLILEWDLESPHHNSVQGDGGKEQSREGRGLSRNWLNYPKLLEGAGPENCPHPVQNDREAAGEEAVLLAVPVDIHSMKRTDSGTAAEWRFALRAHFTALFDRGYTAVGLLRVEGNVHYYVIEKEKGS
ncbi:GNAT family N-acetyltransferase [Paenibacillus senegalensis]|uniref:GNAT family N-acetyltransferase n=1 Tax=Paenibacillus senegalensis TaxID=1465766 RepID=UPI000287B457|nr:GNAT family N-acetyltransferase [Paenibacillus senegalensis]